MPTDRVLVEIVTAANMAGVETAQAGFLKMNLSTLALGAALGIVVAGAKSMIDISRKSEDANKDLAQAVDNSKQSVGGLKDQFDQWVSTNSRYIKDQFDAEAALASFVRAGANAKDAMRELNDALDLSVIKGTDVKSAQELITLALAGNSRGLRGLGITTDEYNAIMKDKHLPLAERQRRLLELIESKTKDGRKAQDDLGQSTNDLQNHWIELSKKGGPVLTTALDAVVQGANAVYDAFDHVGKDDKLWSNISDRLVNMARWLHDYILGPIYDFFVWLDTKQQQAASSAASGGKFGTGVGGKGPTPGGNAPQTIVVQNKLVLGGREIDLVANTIVNNARFRPGT